MMKFLDKLKPSKQKEAKQRTEKNVFQQAQSWVDECAADKEVSLSWFKLGFGTSMSLNVLLVIAVTTLASFQTLVPMLVHHYDNGVVTIDPIKGEIAEVNEAQIESDIVRYITSRESYDASSYRYQFDLVTQMSNPDVVKDYFSSQSKSSPDYPIKKFGNDTERSIHVYALNFLDRDDKNIGDVNKNHHDLVEVTFKVIDKSKTTGQVKEIAYNALVSWRYTGMPTAPSERWSNWAGFEVTRYSKQLRNI